VIEILREMIVMSGIKQGMKRIIDQLPDDITWDDVMAELFSE